MGIGAYIMSPGDVAQGVDFVDADGEGWGLVRVEQVEEARGVVVEFGTGVDVVGEAGAGDFDVFGPEFAGGFGNERGEERGKTEKLTR